MPKSATVTHLRSIQGEQQDTNAGYVAADQDTVDEFIHGATDKILECRMRGHRWPFKRARSGFSGFDEGTGRLINREKCGCCGLAWRVEYWEAVRSGKGYRYERIATQVEYDKPAKGKPSYLAPSGKGHITRRQIDETLMTQSLKGMNLTAVKKAAKAS